MPPNRKKGEVKKPRVVKNVKQREKFDREMKILVRDEFPKIHDLIKRFQIWYEPNKNKLNGLFDLLKWPIHYSTFCLCLSDTASNFNDLEMHILFRLLEPDPEHLYLKCWVDMPEEMWKTFQKLKSEQITEMSGAFAETKPLWLMLTFYPMNLTHCRMNILKCTVVDTMPVRILPKLVQANTECVNTDITIFEHETSNLPLRMDQEGEILRDLGYIGGRRSAPKVYKLYYVRNTGFVDCPLLTMDCHPCVKYVPTKADLMRFLK